MSRGGTGWDSRTRRRDSSDAATNSSPSTPTTNPGQRRPTPGTRPNSAIVSALLNDVRAADARTRWAGLASSPVNHSCATEIATNSRPISAPATPADAARKVSNEGGVTGVPVWIVRRACVRKRPPRLISHQPDRGSISTEAVMPGMRASQNSRPPARSGNLNAADRVPKRQRSANSGAHGS